MSEAAIENNKQFIPLSLSLSPAGYLYLYTDSENDEHVPLHVVEKIKDFFEIGSVIGLLRLGITDFAAALPPSFAYWQDFSKLFVTEVSKFSGLEMFSVEDIAQLSPPFKYV